jgi:hypothetical protein
VPGGSYGPAESVAYADPLASGSRPRISAESISALYIVGEVALSEAVGDLTRALRAGALPVDEAAGLPLHRFALATLRPPIRQSKTVRSARC